MVVEPRSPRLLGLGCVTSRSILAVKELVRHEKINVLDGMITISPNIELLKEAERMFETFKSEDIDRLSKYSSRYASRLDMIFPLAFKQRTKLMRQDNPRITISNGRGIVHLKESP